MYGPSAGFKNAEDGLMDRWVKWPLAVVLSGVKETGSI